MEYSDGFEAVNDWEHIQPPLSGRTMTWWLFVMTAQMSLPATGRSCRPHLPRRHHTRHRRERKGRESWKWGRVRARLGILRSEIIGIAYGTIRRYAVCPAGLLSVTDVVAVVLAAAYGRRWIWLRRQVERDRKEHLIHLFGQKDQKINQLLLQIARMNQFLSASRRDRVLQVVVDSSHNVTPRF